jgi:glycosyltransferase involved in cell wall biosynthesis
MELLWQRGVDATLVLAGPVMTDFERFMARRAPTTRSRTKIVGYLDESSKRDLFAAGDVFAQTSRTDSFGIVFMEAWLNGTPVVAANIPGVNDVVEHGRTGLLVRYGDVPATAAAIERLLCDRAEAAALAARGAARTHALWTWDKVYERVRPAFEHGRVV